MQYFHWEHYFLLPHYFLLDHYFHFSDCFLNSSSNSTQHDNHLKHLPLHIRGRLLCWVPTFPDCLFQFPEKEYKLAIVYCRQSEPDKAAAKNLRLPLLGALLAHVVHFAV